MIIAKFVLYGIALELYYSNFGIVLCTPVGVTI
jgi:hypothetical protein